MNDYYKILELESGATQEQIEKQYRFLLHAWHPDKFSTQEQKDKAGERVREINEAYSVLGDTTKRNIYDRGYRSGFSTAQKSASNSPKPDQKPSSKPPPSQTSRPTSKPTHRGGQNVWTCKVCGKENRDYLEHCVRCDSAKSFVPFEESEPKSASQKDTKNYRTSDFQDANRFCENCGVSAPTKYVEFYETVGAIFFRFSRSAKGKLCKPCINYYFWNFTGKTIILGWWGIISFFLTPFILLNNILRYIFTIGMREPSLKRTPKPSPFWILSTIGGVLLIGYLILSFLPSFFSFTWSANSPTPYSTSSSIQPTNTSRPRPTSTPEEVIKDAQNLSNCIRWTQISLDVVGEKVCVYGKVRHIIYSTKQNGNLIKFSNPSKTFSLYNEKNLYPSLKINDCIAAEEVLQLSDDQIPYMVISELYKCASWME